MQAFVQLLLVVFWVFFAILSTIDCIEIAQFTRPFREKVDEKREKNDSIVSSPTLAFRLPVVENDNT